MLFYITGHKITKLFVFYHKKVVFLWQNFKNMGANSSYNLMYNAVKQANEGTIFIPDDFTLFGTPDAVRSGLSRLCRNGDLYRIAKGIYYTPQYDKWDGSLRQPALDTIALKIAQRDNAHIIPSGAYALNRLGLSPQVPTNIVYITDGSARQIKLGDGRSITFRHSNNLSSFAYQSQLMQLAVLAMREIGENELTTGHKELITNIIKNHVSEQEFNHDIVLAPTWIKKILQN